MVYRTLDQIDFTLDDLPTVPAPGRVLLTTPAYFDVQYVINPHMEGNVGDIDREEAWNEWTALRDAYARLSIEPVTVGGQEGLPDMVFCANQTLPYHRPDRDANGVVLSRMNAEQRQGEVAHYAAFFEHEGYDVLELPASLQTDFEGMGDAIWHPGRRLLWGGYGFRTDVQAYDFIADRLDVPVVALQLDDPEFYHLDTCFSVLDERSVLVYSGAFQPEGMQLIRHFFDRVIEAPEDEARSLFACNAHCPDRRHVIIQRGCERTNALLRDAGFEPVEVETSEFLKAGGSVFCMKLMMW